MIKTLSHLLLPLSIVLSSGMQAQEYIPLTDAEIRQFGIAFSPVQVMDGETGMQIPATVVNSPMLASAITARYEGVVQSWNVMPGEQVEAGQLLGVLNSQEILGIQQEWIFAESSLQEARFNVEKDEKLNQEGVISQQRLIQTQRQYQEARINAQAARQKLILAGFSEEQLGRLMTDHEGLGMYYIRTPVAGTISHITYIAGTFVPDNAELVSFSSGNLWVRAELPARLGRQLEIGQKVRLAEGSYSLTLRQQDYAADEYSQLLHVFAEFDQAARYLPGQVVSLVLSPAGGGVLVPADAVVHSGDETQVFVKVDGGVEAITLSLTPVGSAYLAQSGLNAGDQLVTRGTAQLKGMQLGLGGE